MVLARAFLLATSGLTGGPFRSVVVNRMDKSLLRSACVQQLEADLALLTQAALTFHPELFAAGISICGMSDLNTWYRNTEPWIATAAYPKYGHPIGDRDLLERLSPLLRASALTAPLLLVHGANDTNVPPTESQQMFEALRALDRTVELLVFDDDGHEIVKRENRAALVNAMTTWLLKAFSAASVS